VVAVFAVRWHASGREVFTNALGVARALELHAYWYAHVSPSCCSTPASSGPRAVTLSTSYAFGDVFGLKPSLNRKLPDGPAFLRRYTPPGSLGRGHRPSSPGPGACHHHVQALAGAAAQRHRSCCAVHDPEVLRPWVNRRWLTAWPGVINRRAATLSGTLVVRTRVPY